MGTGDPMKLSVGNVGGGLPHAVRAVIGSADHEGQDATILYGTRNVVGQAAGDASNERTAARIRDEPARHMIA